MAQNNQEKEYIKNIFAKQVWSDGDRQLISLGIKKKEFIAELNKMQEKEDGFVNFTMGTRKDDTAKLAIWKDDYKKNSQSGSSTPSYARNSNSSKPNQSNSAPAPAAEDDDLPF